MELPGLHVLMAKPEINKAGDVPPCRGKSCKAQAKSGCVKMEGKKEGRLRRVIPSTTQTFIN